MSILNLLDDKVSTRLAEVNQKLAVRDVLYKQLRELDSDVLQYSQAVTDSEEAAVVVGAVEKTQQDQLKQKLEKLVSYALTVIFERTFKFVVDFDSRGQQSEAKFLILDENGVTQPVKDAHGGGILVVVAYILRAIVMMSSQPRLSPIMIDDESLVQVSAEFRPRLIEFLRKFAESANLQLIMITHQEDLKEIADKIYRFTLVGGVTEVKEL